MKKRKIINFFTTVLIFQLAYHVLTAQTVSPFNHFPLKDTSVNYSFIVSGHFHGSSTSTSTYPASTLLANIDTLNSLKPLFLMSLGDLFLDVNEVYIHHYKKSLFHELKMPLFNAVGNHDLSNGNVYEKIFGKTFFYFTCQTELFVVLNTEETDGKIQGEQLELLKTAMSKAKAESIKNVFIFSHRPLWAESDLRYHNLFKGNTRGTFESNFEKEIKPLLNALQKPVYWISGSMGGGPASFFYDKYPNSTITFMQTAIRDLPRDAVLHVSVNNGNIDFKGISLTGEQLQPIENYNIDYWQSSVPPEKEFNFRLLPYLTLQMIKHYYFWIGIITGVSLFLISTFLIRQWKKRK